jgi:hypothetical protein
MESLLITVVEMPEFLAKARTFMGEETKALLINFLARNPEAGDLIPGTGGVRKLRWALEGRGKSGGARVIYYFHNASIPLFVITAYAKNQQANISDEDRNNFRRLTKALIESYGKREP